MNRPRIVFLDSSTVDAGDISFESLAALGELVLHPVTSPDQILQRCHGAEIVLTNKTLLKRETLAACPGLRLVAITATGTNNVDLAAARDLGIRVTNVRGYSTPSVAQHTLCLLLNLATNIHQFAHEAEAWAQSPHFTRLDHPMREVAGLTLGIVGIGGIGSCVAALGRALGMEIIGLQRPGSAPDPSVTIPRLPATEFFGRADFISLHCPLTPETEKLINAHTLQLMKPSACLINTARGPLIDEPALLEALQQGRIGGAALDVLSVEPPAPDHPLLTANLPNLIITPHTAWAATESRRRLLDGIQRNLAAFLAGEEPPDRVA
ncbi:MAG: glycerate dehydrogenase [Verrucomicrobia bacterium]|jgi:glycerate dehydrogenase|nr:MAG: glycerate dehydrogenase [Verrucomicrobiota bacterium]